ncbi:MAG TPA: hypothetical protein VHN99_02970 [Deinococcales bacterium]|nr:hypothetical protein [Deinococcales bacterium]
MSRGSEFEQVKRILDMVREARVSQAEASKLLGALNTRFGGVAPGTWERLLAEVGSGMDTADLATLITPPEPPDGPARGAPGRKTARLMRLDIETADGSEIRVNLPLGLANFALRLIPQDALAALRDQGLDPGSLSELLRGDLPDGEVLHLESNDGTEVVLKVE